MEKLDIKQVQSRCLKIAIEFDRICTKYNIPYYMLGGTMLGAIRHKGFIPWDDDMDFGVPRPYYKKLFKILNEELNMPFRCSSFSNHPGVYSAFFKIEDTTTVVFDKRIPLSIEKQLGVNIDIFPLDYCEEDNEKVKKVMQLGHLYQSVFVLNPNGNLLKNLIKRIVRFFCPVSRIFILNKQESILESLPSGSFLANVYGRWKDREIIPIEWYGVKNYDFENVQFRGIENYDKYLSRLYGDYMKLPPVDQQKAHVENSYIR